MREHKSVRHVVASSDLMDQFKDSEARLRSARVATLFLKEYSSVLRWSSLVLQVAVLKYLLTKGSQDGLLVTFHAERTAGLRLAGSPNPQMQGAGLVLLDMPLSTGANISPKTNPEPKPALHQIFWA